MKTKISNYFTKLNSNIKSPYLSEVSPAQNMQHLLNQYRE
ncbi:hypothetical protein PULV_a2807 [Pseudoalteromonas ulvae UL12]|nr:hypothetical protein [Pseudoalteromonas ulvae UL12]